VGKYVEGNAGGSGVRLWAVERGKTHREWLSAEAALERGRVGGGRPEKGSRLALKWTSRFLGLERSWWPCRPGRSVDEEEHTSDAAAGDEQDDARWPVVSFERRPTVRGGGPSPDGDRESWLGIVRQAVAGVEAHSVAAW
jgi:hypothetical protein